MKPSRMSLAAMTFSAISRNAITVFLSSPGSIVAAEPFAIVRARCAASSTSSKRFATLSTQSSTVMRAILPSTARQNIQKDRHGKRGHGTDSKAALHVFVHRALASANYAITCWIRKPFPVELSVRRQFSLVLLWISGCPDWLGIRCVVRRARASAVRGVPSELGAPSKSSSVPAYRGREGSPLPAHQGSPVRTGRDSPTPGRWCAGGPRRPLSPRGCATTASAARHHRLCRERRHAREGAADGGLCLDPHHTARRSILGGKQLQTGNAPWMVLTVQTDIKCVDGVFALRSKQK